MLLIDTRQPPPDPIERRAPWEPNWHLWTWVALTIAAAGAADAATGVVAYVLALAVVTCACRAVCAVLPPLDGLREHRQ
jgi:hypothetical protein